MQDYIVSSLMGWLDNNLAFEVVPQLVLFKAGVLHELD
jgi:hypothetical protein